MWPWGGEPIYHNGLYSGMTTCSSYGPSIGKMICIGWITNPHPETGELQVLTNEFINQGLYEINIAGKKVHAKCSLYPSKLSTKQPMHGWFTINLETAKLKNWNILANASSWKDLNLFIHLLSGRLMFIGSTSLDVYGLFRSHLWCACVFKIKESTWRWHLSGMCCVIYNGVIYDLIWRMPDEVCCPNGWKLDSIPLPTYYMDGRWNVLQTTLILVFSCAYYGR